MKLRILFTWLPILAVLGGCAGTRLVIDLVPADDALTESVVIDEKSPGFSRTGKIALVDVTGTIVDAERGGALGPKHNPVSRFAEALERAEADRRVGAVIVRVNSPGGTVTASDVMYRELMHFRERTGKPVVVLMADVAASGGYYLACGADEIIAHPTTITGSIGVIMQTVNVAEGMRRIGIRADAITSGPNKALGSPFEPMPAEHRAILQGIVDEFYAGFVEIVESRRPAIERTNLAAITDGRVVTGTRAAALGLVDGVGDLRDAFAAAKSRAGMTHARLVKYHDPLASVNSPYASYAAEVSLVRLDLDLPLLDTPGFYYLWDPTVWSP